MPQVSHYIEHRDYILRSIRNAHLRHARPATVRELAFELGVSVSTVHSYLQQMAQEGLIEWQQRRRRSYQLTRRGFQHLSPQAEQPA